MLLFRSRILFFLVIVSLAVVFGDEDDNTQISGVNDKCAEFCSKTYAAHTFDISSAEQSCKQGCKLYSIIQFMKPVVVVGDPAAQTDGQKTNSTAISAACEFQCGEAYSDEIFKTACVDGCSHQTTPATGQIRVVIDDSSPLFPFANKLISDSFGDLKDRMKTQWENLRNWLKNDALLSPSTANENSDKDANDDGKIVNSLQRMGDGLLKLFQDLNSASQDNDQEKKPRLFGGPEDVADHSPIRRGQNSSELSHMVQVRPAHVDGSEFEGPISVGNEDDNGEPIIIVKMIPLEDVIDESGVDIVGSNEPSPPARGDVIYGDPDDGWLACLARRTQNLSMLSRWLLCATLMLSVLCMFWLCLALMRNKRMRRRRLYMQYRAGKSDVVYFMPPPAYEKTPTSAAYLPLDKDQKVPPPSPPPVYKSLESIAVKTEEPKPESA